MNIRTALLALLAFLIGACTRVGHIQQTAPVRTASFTGDHKTVAQCIQGRLGGRSQDEGFGERYVVFDSAKGRMQGDLTHWSMTVARTSPGEGRVEWRVTRPPETRSLGSAPGGARPSSAAAYGLVSEETEKEYWNPVLDCVARAKGS